MEGADQHKPRGTARAARIRAAIAYRDLGRKAVANHMGVSVETVSRWQAGTSTPDRDERDRLAELCHVPQHFLESGFGDETPRQTLLSEDDVRDLVQAELIAAMTRGDGTRDERRPASGDQAS